ncbi:hypothetical protein BO99DRAFT_95016 [Aspergillus violaceofuscus CBS 115571]|uniref:Uncharacterized protein n=1 Tax=Aspergillus violaceofuscus (strain CBS 115571) TaxID=1450538 RepID=A0A2V5HGQ8_ASPV1|nr:hypothetical protein BO99DRAFT_95016 [Aspergillus violaceofuscus CBS 115571]
MIHDPPLLFQMGPAPVLPFVLLRRPLLLSALTSSSSPPPPLPSSLLPSLSTLSTASLPDSLARPQPHSLTHPHRRVSLSAPEEPLLGYLYLSRLEIGNSIPAFRATPRSSRVQFSCRAPPI